VDRAGQSHGAPCEVRCHAPGLLCATLPVLWHGSNVLPNLRRNIIYSAKSFDFHEMFTLLYPLPAQYMLT